MEIWFFFYREFLEEQGLARFHFTETIKYLTTMFLT
jgi:hypothetical protein